MIPKSFFCPTIPPSAPAALPSRVGRSPSPCGTGSTVTVQLAELRSVHASQDGDRRRNVIGRDGGGIARNGASSTLRTGWGPGLTTNKEATRLEAIATRVDY